ncbi:YpoC family protein [Bacillus sp. FJAT-47783]|uniref:YpoC family protein n=1 Tax=Bacillus sp. FJAT-47783 TaxID=2922712 RepID=UPI001FADADF5|nr:hypothetical protein [Bacillus sp. FJAT-47783]
MGYKVVKIPSSYQTSPFFENQKELKINVHADVEENLKQTPFFYEFLYTIEEKEAYKPWERWDEHIPLLFKRWKKVNEQLAYHFRDRKIKQIRSHMQEGIALFIVFIHWMNEAAVKSTSIPLSYPFPYKPVNVEERLTFIVENITLYHAFIQLSELFQEGEKIFYKKLALVN